VPQGHARDTARAKSSSVQAGAPRAWSVAQREALRPGIHPGNHLYSLWLWEHYHRCGAGAQQERGSGLPAAGFALCAASLPFPGAGTQPDFGRVLFNQVNHLS
jgi:hypothetical protein